VFDARRTAVLLDRQPLWLEAVEQVLGRIEVDVVGKATAPKPALELIQEHRPDIFVTGVGMEEGEMDGIACIRRARELAPELRAVVLSSNAGTESIDKALDAGAGAYVIKSAHPDDLASAIRQAFQHSIYLAGSRPEPRATDSETPGLTRREREILKLVAEGHSNARVAKMLWVTEQTVKFHLSNVYRKLNVSNRTEAARWAQLSGLMSATNGIVGDERRPHLVAG